MRRVLILAALAMPIAAYAQQATMEDKATAAEATVNDLTNLVVNLRAQIAADQRERGDLLKKVAEAEKAKPTTPNNAPKP